MQSVNVSQPVDRVLIYADTKIRGLAAVRRCYIEGDGDRYAKL
jgi:hypothetical protein